MDKKEEFKSSVRKHPKLVTYVKDGKTTWQQFYEIYDLYGASEEAWKDYLSPTVITSIGVADILSYIKNINLEEFQNGINSIQRVLGLLGDISNKNKETTYKPRPMYKKFDD